MLFRSRIKRMVPSPKVRQAATSSCSRSTRRPAMYLSESARRVTDLNCSRMGEIFNQLAKLEMIPHCSSFERRRKLMGSISSILM